MVSKIVYKQEFENLETFLWNFVPVRASRLLFFSALGFNLAAKDILNDG